MHTKAAMKNVVLAAALAFGTPVTRNRAVPAAARKIAARVLTWLDRRRARIDDQAPVAS